MRLIKRLVATLGMVMMLQSVVADSAHAARRNGGVAHAGSFGLGVVLGEPTGLSAKYFVSSRNAVDFGLAYSFSDFLYLFSDYLFHFPGAFGSSSQFASQLSPYLGVGGIFIANTETHRSDRKFFTSEGADVGLGLRLPLGIEWSPGRPPLGIFVELVPGIGIVPSTFGFFEGGLGIRYYF